MNKSNFEKVSVILGLVPVIFRICMSFLKAI